MQRNNSPYNTYEGKLGVYVAENRRNLTLGARMDHSTVVDAENSTFSAAILIFRDLPT